MRQLSAFAAALAWLVVSVAMGAQSEDPVESLLVQLKDTQGAARLSLLVELVERGRSESVPEIETYGAEALDWLAQSPDPKSELKVRSSLAWVLSQTGRSQEALEHATRCRDIAESLGDRALLAEAYYSTAVAHYFGSDPEPAYAAALQSFELETELSRRSSASRSATLLGAISRSRSDYVESLDHHLEALRLAEAEDDADGVARSRNNIALLYRQLEYPEQALEYFRRASDHYRDQGNSEQLAATLNNIGFTLIEMERGAEALPVLEEGLRLSQQFDRPFSRARLLSNLAFAHEKLGDWETSLDFLQQTLDLRTQLQDTRGLARTLGSLGKLWIDRERWEDAERDLERGLAEATSMGARTEQEQILEMLAQVYENQGRPAEALAALREHRAIRADLELDEASQKVAQLEFDRQRAVQDLRLSLEETRSRVLQLATALLIVLVTSLLLYARARNRSLGQLRASHSKLEEANALIEESEQRYRSLFFDEVVAKMVIDQESGNLTEANAPAAALLGVPAAELRGTSVADIPLDWLREAANRWREVGSDELSLSRRYIENGMERAAQVHLTPVAVAGKPSVLLTVHDLTERMRAEDDRIRIDKLESLGQLAGGIAHNFNNALAAVLGYVGLARSEAGEDSEVESLLALAEESVADSTGLTAQLLSFSRGGAPQRETVDLGEQVRSAVRLASSPSERSVELSFAPDLWPAQVDPAQFQQMIGNLVTNALQAVEREGHVRVRVSNHTATEALSKSAGPGKYSRIEVADDGEGITPEIQNKIMDPYFTTRNEGTGLGLATAFAIALRHDGHLDFVSTPGEGTTFRAFVPAAPEARPPETAHTAEPVRGGHERILVMDDDPAIRSIYLALLERQGYDVAPSEDGKEAIELYRAAREQGKPFDLVILDLTVPGGLGGKPTMEGLLEVDPRALGIVISGYSDDPVMADCESYGFAASMPKPFRYDDLARLVRRVLDDRADPPVTELDPKVGKDGRANDEGSH